MQSVQLKRYQFDSIIHSEDRIRNFVTNFIA